MSITRSDCMGAAVAALELLALMEKRVELLLPWPVQRIPNRVMFMHPLAALDCQYVLLGSDFDGLLCHIVELPEAREWHIGTWKRLPGLCLLAFSTNLARKLGWFGGGGSWGGRGDGRGRIARMGGRGGRVFLWRGGCAQALHFSHELLQGVPDLLQCLQVRIHLVEAASHLLLERRDAAIHACQDFARGGFGLALRVRKLERDIPLAGHGHQLLFRQVLLACIGAVLLLRYSVLFEPTLEGFEVGAEQGHTLRKIKSAAHRFLFF